MIVKENSISVWLFVSVCFLSCEPEVVETGNLEERFIYIDNDTLDDVYYHQVTFDSLTTLVFENLTTVSNSIYFHECSNIKEVQFPNLVSVGNSDSDNPYFYFHGNDSLENILTPNLTKVFGYVYVNSNASLDASNILCSLGNVYPQKSTLDSCKNAFIQVTLNANDSTCFAATIHACNENDNDLDGIDNATDNCSDDFNPNQSDLDSDGIGDACDDDKDGDGILNASDNCPSQHNPNQLDSDEDGIGDVCQDLATIIIDDGTLEDIYYHQITYDIPTTLIFPNLTSVTNSVYFHQCLNIKEVQFPNLETVGNSDSSNPYLYFHENHSLENIMAPNLTDVFGYIYVNGNSSLDASKIFCSLENVYPYNPTLDSCRNAYIQVTLNANDETCFAASVHTCN